MELIEGPSLAQLLRANGPLEPRLVVQLALPLLDALEFAHSHGIVHRDIKPANIMVAPSFKPYLVDFGLAKGLGGAELTQSGIALGTPAYIAPEQARGEKPDRLADIYSFAVTLYELLSGQRPYPGDDQIQVVVARMTEDPVPLLQVAPECPSELAAVVMKGMAREPEMRYASAVEMALALQAAAAFEVLPEPPNGEVLVQARPAPVELATARTQLLPRQTNAQRKLPLARLAVLAALGFVGAVGAFLALRERPSAGNLEGSFPTPTALAVAAAASSEVTEPPPAPPPSPTATPGRRATPIPLKSLRPVRPPEPLGDTVVPAEGTLADTCAGVRVAALVTVADDGSVKAARVVQGGGEPCDGEALRTLRGMRWRPAESAAGEPVEASVAVVIEFVTREGHQ
jgi:serine/threonine protein kinase